eukprot:3785965-Pleurochrysis_carterae.AAC.2
MKRIQFSPSLREVSMAYRIFQCDFVVGFMLLAFRIRDSEEWLIPVRCQAFGLSATEPKRGRPACTPNFSVEWRTYLRSSHSSNQAIILLHVSCQKKHSRRRAIILQLLPTCRHCAPQTSAAAATAPLCFERQRRTIAIAYYSSNQHAGPERNLPRGATIRAGGEGMISATTNNNGKGAGAGAEAERTYGAPQGKGGSPAAVAIASRSIQELG